jgi:hypothetical protein
LAPARRRHFKRAFEIGLARESAFVNALYVPQRGRDFAPEQTAIRRRHLLSYGPSGQAGFKTKQA